MIWKLASKLLHRISVKPFLKTLEDPIAAQEDSLKRLLNYAANTHYGKKHRFSDIRGFEDLVQRIPVNQYADFEPLILRELEGNSNVLYPEPIENVMATSGTTGEPKLIPYTHTCNKSCAKLRMRVFAFADYLRPFFHGKLLVMAAPSVYKRIGKWDVGFVSGHLAKNGNPLLSRKIVPKGEVFDLQDWDQKFRVSIQQGVETRNLTGAAGITSFVLAVLRRTKYESYDWLKDESTLSTKTQRVLDKAVNDGGSLDLRTIWPELSVIVSAGVTRDLYTATIHDLVGDVHIHDSYSGTEAMYGLQVFQDSDGVAPFVDDNFFEFAPVQDGPLAADVETIPLSDVKINTPYRIVISSPTSLWRYDVHDLVQFTSLNPLTFKCLGKSENVMNLSGEKVTEWDVSSALTATCDDHGIQLREYVVAPEINASGASYHIFAELSNRPEDLKKFTQEFDDALQNTNNLYQHVRHAGTLQLPSIHVLAPGSFDQYQQHCLQNGVSIAGQTKIRRIIKFEEVTTNLLPTVTQLIA